LRIPIFLEKKKRKNLKNTLKSAFDLFFGLSHSQESNNVTKTGFYRIRIIMMVLKITGRE
jgi:hypothetical protein